MPQTADGIRGITLPPRSLIFWLLSVQQNLPPHLERVLLPAATDAKPLIGSLATGFIVATERWFAAKVATDPAAALPNATSFAQTSFRGSAIGFQIPVPVPAPFPYIP